MMFRSKKQHGFSLVELMVVLAIMGAVMGLTGGLVTSVVAKQEKQVEIEKLKQLVKNYQYKAVFTGKPYTFYFQTQSLAIESPGDEKVIIDFNQLVFVNGQISFSTSSHLSNDSLKLIDGVQIKEVAIESIFESYEKK